MAEMINLNTLTPEKSKAIIYIIGGIVAIIIIIIIASKLFGGFDSLLEALNLKESKEEKERNEEIEAALENSTLQESAFNPNFHKTAPGGTIFPDEKKTFEVITDIWDSVGIFWDDSDKALAAIKRLNSKAQVSFITDAFSHFYDRDLFKWMENKFDTEAQEKSLIAIINYVLGLPKY